MDSGQRCPSGAAPTSAGPSRSPPNPTPTPLPAEGPPHPHPAWRDPLSRRVWPEAAGSANVNIPAELANSAVTVRGVCEGTGGQGGAQTLRENWTGRRTGPVSPGVRGDPARPPSSAPAPARGAVRLPVASARCAADLAQTLRERPSGRLAGRGQRGGGGGGGVCEDPGVPPSVTWVPRGRRRPARGAQGRSSGAAAAPRHAGAAPGPAGRRAYPVGPAPGPLPRRAGRGAQAPGRSRGQGHPSPRGPARNRVPPTPDSVTSGAVPAHRSPGPICHRGRAPGGVARGPRGPLHALHVHPHSRGPRAGSLPFGRMHGVEHSEGKKQLGTRSHTPP